MTATVHMGSHLTALSTTLSQWIGFWGSGNPSALANEIRVPAPCAGTLRNLHVRLLTAPGGVTARVFTVRLNSADTALKVTITGAATEASNTTDVVTFAAGDTLSMRSDVTGVPAASIARWSVESRTTVDTDAIIWSSGIRFGNTAQNFFPFEEGNNSTANTAESQSQGVCPLAVTVTAFYVQQNGANEAVGARYDLFISRNAVAEATSQLTVISPARTANAVGLSIAVAAGDKLAIRTKGTALPLTGGQDGVGVCYTPSVAGAAIVVMADQSNPSSAVVNYNMAHTWFSVAWTATQGAQAVMAGPTGFTISRLFCAFQIAPGNTRSRQIEVYRNGAATGLSVSLAGSSPGVVSDTSHQDEVVDGDILEMVTTPTNTPTTPITIQWGYCQNVHVGSKQRTLRGAGV